MLLPQFADHRHDLLFELFIGRHQGDQLRRTRGGLAVEPRRGGAGIGIDGGGDALGRSAAGESLADRRRHMVHGGDRKVEFGVQLRRSRHGRGAPISRAWSNDALN